VTLQERAQIAEKIKADLFISVHINSSTDPRAKGIETFYLDNHDDIAVKKVEKTENINPGTADGIQQILIDLAVEQTVQTSKPLAFLVHAETKKNLKGKLAMVNRGVKPALFYVLALSKRPGILLEAGFMTNDDDLKKIQQPKFQSLYADAVVRGIDQYIRTKKRAK
jgi:N-acetylmuramoyl-L-alanine amidase